MKELPEISKRVMESYTETDKRPVRTNWASELGHKCIRYLVYKRLEWDKATAYSHETLRIFEAGNMIEEIAKRDFERAGFKIIEHNRAYEWREYQISGKLDFVLEDKTGFVFPVEVKGLADHYAKKLTCVEDFFASNKSWVQKYPAQLTMYMLMSNYEYGALYIIGKPSLIPYPAIWVHLDYTFAEDLLQKAQKINEYVTKNEYPPQIEYQESICGKCQFRHLCMPPTNFEGAKFIDNEELEQKLNRREELKESVDEYKQIDEDVKGQFENITEAYIGKTWRIVGKEQKYNKCDIPPEIKKQYTIQETRWITKILKI